MRQGSLLRDHGQDAAGNLSDPVRTWDLPAASTYRYPRENPGSIRNPKVVSSSAGSGSSADLRTELPGLLKALVILQPLATLVTLVALAVVFPPKHF